jgi:hypothetical protein
MPVYVPQPNQPRHVGRLQSLAAILGCDPDGAPRRPVISNTYVPPALPWDERNMWLRKVRRLIAECKEKRESFPHKVESVARTIAELGDVCKASIPYIAAKAGCVENTVKACSAWLESKGTLTWSNTRGKHKSGRIVRQTNLYRLITNFAGATAVIARTMRAIWRERPKVVTVSKGNDCPGLQRDSTYISEITPYEAIKRLAKVSKERTAYFNQLWQGRHAT